MEDGGSHSDGGGGYSGGPGEDEVAGTISINGKGYTQDPARVDNSPNCGGGGSYFVDGLYDESRTYKGISWGQKAPGQGAFLAWPQFSGFNWPGNGGIAGKGGTITITNANVYAYNGNECTLDKYLDNNEVNTEYYYKPLEIYAQKGVACDVYLNNISYFSNILKEKYEKAMGCTFLWNSIASNYSECVNECITASQRTIKPIVTDYGQGIGSGAGYIELSNGTVSMN